jgi:hypothetical protein
MSFVIRRHYRLILIQWLTFLTSVISIWRTLTQAQDQFLVIQTRRTRFSTATALRNDLTNAAAVRVSTHTECRRLHEGNLRSGRPANFSPWRVVIVRPVWNGSWSIHGWPCNIGVTFCSLMSPGSAETSRLNVLESGEDEVNGFRLQILLSMTATDVGQLWCGEASAGMDESSWLFLIEAHWQVRHLRQPNRLYAGVVGDQFILMADNARPIWPGWSWTA